MRLRSYTAGLIFSVVFLSACRHQQLPEQLKLRALRIPPGSNVKVVSTNGTKTQGVLTGMSNDAVSVKTAPQAAAQTLPFNAMSSLKKIRGKKFGVKKPGGVDASLGTIPEGSPVVAKLSDGSKVEGRYTGKTADGLTMQVPQGGQMTSRTIPLDQISSIKQPKHKLPGMPALQSPAMSKKVLSGLPVGSPVNVTMPNGQTVSGKYQGMTADGFSLQSLEGGNLVTKNLSFDQVASVKPPGIGIKKYIPGLHPPAMQTPGALKSAALAIPAGSPVTLAMPDGSKTSGKLMGVTNDGLQVQSMQAGNVVTQNVGFDQIGSIKQGVPLTASDRMKKVGKAGIMVIVTGAISGVLAKKL